MERFFEIQKNTGDEFVRIIYVSLSLRKYREGAKFNWF